MPENESMKPVWRISDLIDLECLLLRDEGIVDGDEQEAIKRRDRNFYLQKIAPTVEGKGVLTRSLLLHCWLKVRQEAEQADELILFGRVLSDLYKKFCVVLLMLGLFVGGGLAFPFLGYTGAEPVNVLVYLIIFVGSRFVFYGFYVVLYFCRLFGWHGPHSIINELWGWISRGILWFIRYFEKKLTGQKRLQISAVQGFVRGKIKTHGSFLRWPVFMLLQIFSIGFCSGALFTTLYKIVTADIAFGWQTSIRVSGKFVFMLVESIATPWSWFVPEKIAYPSLVHINGSQMILKEGIYHLSTEDLVSWWPFLCLSVVFYGLLPRILLLLVGIGCQRWSMSRLQFKGASYGQLIQRMTSSLVSSQSPIPDSSKQPHPQGMSQGDELDESRIVVTDDQRALHNTAVALIPDELHEKCSLNTLQTLMQKRLGVTVRETLLAGESYHNEQVMLSQLEVINNTSNLDNVVILQEAWQPPILEFLLFLKRLRSRLGADIPLFVALIGKPRSDTIFTSIKSEDLEMWRLKIRAMGEADIQILQLVVET